MAAKHRKQAKAAAAEQILPIVAMREIFDDSQRLDKHQSCLQRMVCLQNMYSRSNQSVIHFYKEFLRDVKQTLWAHDSRSPYGQHSIGFIIKYLLTFGQTDGEDSDDMYKFIDAILEDVVIPYTNSKKPECRINACNFIRRLAEELEEFNEDTFEKLCEALLDRSVDKISSVRAAAILAMHRFQVVSNENDLVILAIHFHLNNDPDYEVRHNCLKAMSASQLSLQHFIGATRDIKDVVRKTAYLQISKKLQMKCFKIEERLTILKNGLKDRSPAVRKVVETVLIPSWVESCKNDLIELLIALDIQTDIELIEKFLEIYFKHLSKEKVTEDSNKTKFNQLVDEFRDRNLAKERVFNVSLNVENVFLWRYLCEFSKANHIECQEFITNESNEQNPIESQTSDQITIDVIAEEVLTQEQASDEPKVQKVELFDLLVPDVPYFCAYLEKFLNNITKEELNITDALDYEFIFNQFMKVALLLDIEDDAQRKILIQTMHRILVDNNIGDKFHNYIIPIMKCLAKKGFTDNNSYLEFTVEIISEIFASILSQTVDESDTNGGQNRELEEKRDQRIAEIEKCKNSIKDIENQENQESDAIEELHKKMEELELEVKSIKQQITLNTLSQYSQTTSSQTTNSTSFTDHPKAQMRCLQIFSGCLEFGDFCEVNVVMQTHIDKVCLTGILSPSDKIRCVATRCLGLVCLKSPQYFKKYLYLLIQIFTNDIESTKLIAIQSIFDSLCEHGINIFEDKNGDKETDGEEGGEPFKDKEGDFITSLKSFFDTQLDSEDNEIRQTAAQGVSKLLIHCRMYSPELLSKLIIIWFTPNEDPVIVQFIGDFLRLYSLAESQGVIVGQTALEEAFLITLQTIYEENLRLNCDNLIKFFLKLIADENQVKLADDLLKKMLESEPKDMKLVEDYLLSAVSQLNLIEMESKDLKQFEDNISKIELKLEKSKSKKVKQKLSAIKKNIENRSQQLSADSAFADDFRSVDENNEENEDIFDINTRSTLVMDGSETQPVVSDSDSDSFRTCPESPLQKKRRLSENPDKSLTLTQTSAQEIGSNDRNESQTVITRSDETVEDMEQSVDIDKEPTVLTGSPSPDCNDVEKNVTQNDETIEESNQLLIAENQTIDNGIASIECSDVQMDDTLTDEPLEELFQPLEQRIDEI